MSSWYGDKDPFSKVGYFRLVVVRHNPSWGLTGERDNCTHISGVTTFELGLVSPRKGKNGSHDYNWLNEEITSSCEHQINHVMKDFNNGLYEIVGELYNWSSTSYEGEWEGDSEIRNYRIQQIDFDSALIHQNGSDLITCEIQDLLMLDPLKQDENYRSDYCIHHYMDKKEIMEAHANALTAIINSDPYYYKRTKYDDVKIEEFPALIDILMLQIDSEKPLEITMQAVQIEQIVKKCLHSHEYMMAQEIDRTKPTKTETIPF